MKVILDELTPKEFFSNGGVVKVFLKADVLRKMSGNRGKFLFYEYKAYIRFMRDLYLKYMTKYSDLKSGEVYQQVNEFVELSCRIGTKEYIIDPKFDNVESLEFCNFYYYGDSDTFDMSNKSNKRDAYGIPNVNFSTIKPDDSRWCEFEEQRLKRGFDDSEIWFLNKALYGFIIPRLKTYRDIHCSQAEGLEVSEWNSILDKMIDAFELLKKGNNTEEENERIEEGMKLFMNYINSLWD